MADTNKLFNLDRTSAIFEYSRQMFSPIMVKGQEVPLDIFDLGSKVLLEKANSLDFSTMLPTLNNALINFVFSISKMLFTIFSAIYIGLTNGIRSFDTVISEFIDESSILFKSFAPTLLPIAVGVLLLYAFYMFVRFHKPFLRTFFLGLLGIAFLNVIYAPNYSYSVRGQTKVNKSGVAMIYDKTSAFLEEVSDKASEGLISNKSKVQVVDEKNPEARDLDSQSQSAILIYFEKTLWEAYKGMNADRKSDGTYNLTDQQLIALIAYQNDNKEDFKVGEINLESLAGKADEPKVKQLRGGWINKWTYALVSVFETILSGVILDTIAVMSAAMRVGVLVLFVFLPVILLLAALPFFTNLIPNFFKIYMSYLATSQFLNLFGVMLLVLDMTVYNLFMKFFNNYIIVAFFARLMTYAVLYGFRHHWLHLFSPNKYRATNTMLNKMTSMADKPLQNTLDFAKDKMSTVVLATFGASRLASRQLKEKQEADAKIKSMKTNYNKYKKQGYSDEVAFLKAQQDEENKALQKAKASRPREVYNRSKAFLNRMAAAGYINPEHPNIQRHIEKAETAEQRADDLAEERETFAANSADLGSQIEKREKAEEVFSHYDVSGLKKDGYRSNLSYKVNRNKPKPFKESPHLFLEVAQSEVVYDDVKGDVMGVDQFEKMPSKRADGVYSEDFVRPQDFFIDFRRKIKMAEVIEEDVPTSYPSFQSLEHTQMETISLETSMNYTGISPTAMPIVSVPSQFKQTQNVDVSTSMNYTSASPIVMPIASDPGKLKQTQNVDMETSMNYTSTTPTAMPTAPASDRVKQTRNVDVETSMNYTSTIPTAVPVQPTPGNLKQTQNVDMATSTNYTSTSPTVVPTQPASVNLKQTQNVDVVTSTNYTSTSPTAIPTAPASDSIVETPAEETPAPAVETPSTPAPVVESPTSVKPVSQTPSTPVVKAVDVTIEARPTQAPTSAPVVETPKSQATPEVEQTSSSIPVVSRTTQKVEAQKAPSFKTEVKKTPTQAPEAKAVSTQEVETKSGDTVVAVTDDGLATVRKADGTTQKVAASSVGKIDPEKKTVKIETKDGKVQELPVTGDKTNTLLTIIGLASLGVVTGLLILFKKKA